MWLISKELRTTALPLTLAWSNTRSFIRPSNGLYPDVPVPSMTRWCADLLWRLSGISQIPHRDCTWLIWKCTNQITKYKYKSNIEFCALLNKYNQIKPNQILVFLFKSKSNNGILIQGQIKFQSALLFGRIWFIWLLPRYTDLQFFFLIVLYFRMGGLLNNKFLMLGFIPSTSSTSSAYILYTVYRHI